MNRREFLRRMTIVAAMGGVLLSAGFVLGEKLSGGSGGSQTNIPTLGGTPPAGDGSSTQAINPTTQTSASSQPTDTQSSASTPSTSQASTSGQSSTSAQTSTSAQSSTTQASTSQSSSSSSIPPGYIFVAALSQLTGNAAYFNHPTFGASILVSIGGQWKAFSSTCTHRPCTVGYNGSSIHCPCHGATFDPNSGAVTGGPAPSRLAEYGTLIVNNNLYVGNSIIN